MTLQHLLDHTGGDQQGFGPARTSDVDSDNLTIDIDGWTAALFRFQDTVVLNCDRESAGPATDFATQAILLCDPRQKVSKRVRQRRGKDESLAIPKYLKCHGFAR